MRHVRTLHTRLVGRLAVRLAASAGSIAALVAVVEAGRKWH